MTRAERERFHQLHPAKLATDWGTAIVAGVPLWRRLGVSWAGCWWHHAWLIPAGIVIILSGWLIAWARARTLAF